MLQDPVVARLKQVVDDFKELLPLVQEVGNPALQLRHWQDIFDIIGADIPPNDSGIGETDPPAATLCATGCCLGPCKHLGWTTFAGCVQHYACQGVLWHASEFHLHASAGFAPFSIRHLLQFDLLEQLPKLQVVSAAASKEAALDKALVKMQADWQGVDFRVVEYKDTGMFVVGDTDEVQVRLLVPCS